MSLTVNDYQSQNRCSVHVLTVFTFLYVHHKFLKSDSDEKLKSVFMIKTAAVDMVHVSFELYASSSD